MHIRAYLLYFYISKQIVENKTHARGRYGGVEMDE